MINFIDRALEQYLRVQVPLPESSIGVSFEPPDKAWGAALNRPTVNVFLWDLSRSPGTGSGISQRPAGTGYERRWVNPQIDFFYLITTWATEIRDEHELLGSVMQCILANRELPADLFPAGVVEGPSTLALAEPGDRVPGEFWSALGGRLKPGLQLQVTVPVDVFAWKPAAAPPTSIEVDLVPPPAGPPDGGVRQTAKWIPLDAGGTNRLRRVATVTEVRRGDGGGPDDSAGAAPSPT